MNPRQEKQYSRWPRRRVALGAALLLVAPVLSGCRAAVYQELLETQNRQLESRLRELEWENEDLQSELERCKSTDGKARKPDAEKSSGKSAGKSSGGSRRRAATKSDSGPPSIDNLQPVEIEEGDGDEPESTDKEDSGPESSRTAPAFKGPPKIQPPSSEIPEGQRPAESQREKQSSSDEEPGDGQPGDGDVESSAGQATDESETPAGDEENAEAERSAPANGAFEIGLNPQGTRVVAAKGKRAGGFTLLVEPRDANGQPIKSIGEVAIVAMDPSKQGAMGRLARWDFTAEAAELHFKKTAAGAGMYFELTWPDKPPAVDSFDVYVRLTTTDGRKLVARQSMAGASGAPIDRRWSKADPARRRPAPKSARSNPARREGEPTPADMGDEAPARRR